MWWLGMARLEVRFLKRGWWTRIRGLNKADHSSWQIKKWNNSQKSCVILLTTRLMMRIGGTASNWRESISAIIWSQAFLQSSEMSRIVSTLDSSTFKAISWRACLPLCTLSKVSNSWTLRIIRLRIFVRVKRLIWEPAVLFKNWDSETTKSKLCLRLLGSCLLWSFST